MAKKKQGSSPPGKQTGWNGKYLPDRLIDFSDAPPLTREQLEKAAKERQERLAGRPPSGRPWKKPISIRVDPLILMEIRLAASRSGVPYQTWIHDVLVKAVRKKKSA